MDKQLEYVREKVARSERVVVTGPEGSGRSSMAQALAASLPDGVLIGLPQLTEPDAPAAALMLAASALPSAVEATDGAGRPTEDLKDALRRLERTLILRVPGSVPPLRMRDEHSLHCRERLLAALNVLTTVPRSVWLVDQGLELPALQTSVHKVHLSDHLVELPVEGWGDLRRAARKLRAELPDVLAVPVVWRLAVGAVHLGARAADVAARCRRTTAEAISTLSKALVHQLSPEPDGLIALRRLMLLRVPMALHLVMDAIEAPDHLRPLFAHAIGYGEPYRVNPQVRDALLSQLSELPPLADEALEAAHHGLAKAHAEVDGVPDPQGLAGASLSAWIEKVHHLGSAGPEAQGAWLEQVKPWPELYWQRGRHLSRRRRFLEAAQVYEACLEAFPNDDYAHHYLAWNLEQVGEAPERRRHHYAEAVRLDPSNLWWNSRRIVHLIRAGTWIEAKRAWRRAQKRVDPDGTRLRRDPWVAGQFHRWVVRAWLDVGAWYEARSIMDAVPETVHFREKSILRRSIRSLAIEERKLLEGFIEANKADAAWSEAIRWWERIDQRISDLPVPAFLRGEDGPTLTWSLPGIVVEIEVVEDGPLSWAARDHLTAETAHGEGELDARLEAWLRRVRHG